VVAARTPQAEERLRELIDEVRDVSNPDRSVADAGHALLEQLEVLGRSRSHRETVESHLRVHIVPRARERGDRSPRRGARSRT
jgi:hypothetical protein